MRPLRNYVAKKPRDQAVREAHGMKRAKDAAKKRQQEEKEKERQKEREKKKADAKIIAEFGKQQERERIARNKK